MDPDQATENPHDREMVELLDALVAATSRRDEVFQTVGEARNPDEAQHAIRDLLHVGEIPAAAVVDLQLRDFTEEKRHRIRVRRDELRSRLGGRR